MSWLFISSSPYQLKMIGSSTDSTLVAVTGPKFVPDTYCAESALGFDSLPRVRGIITPEVIILSLNAATWFYWSLGFKYTEQ